MSAINFYLLYLATLHKEDMYKVERLLLDKKCQTLILGSSLSFVSITLFLAEQREREVVLVSLLVRTLISSQGLRPQDLVET